MRGRHCIKTWCKKQQVIALSSAESELYAAVKTAVETMGVQAIGDDIGYKLDVHLYLDSSAALSLISKEGLGKAKYIELQHLWLQEAIKNGRMKARKVPGEINPADLFTKPCNF